MMSEIRIGEVADILGLSILVSFTLVILSMAIIAKGALIYFYEPNKLVWTTEIMLAIYGIFIGIKRIKEIIFR